MIEFNSHIKGPPEKVLLREWEKIHNNSTGLGIKFDSALKYFLIIDYFFK